jgi:dinuclear metal center YbgI/SA1388 family protein
MVDRDGLVRYLHELLQVERFRDYAPNGLQVEGRGVIRRLASAVTASQAAVEAAAAMGADALLVHHGYFWRNEDPRVVGMTRRRLATLLAHDVNLLAYHLPLDAHERYGNNVRLADVLGISVQGRFGPDQALALYGELPVPMTGTAFAAHVVHRLGRAPLHLAADGAAMVRRIGWCTGAAQDYIEAAAALGLDAYLSGEASERTFHAARELNIQFFGAGHHATERFGVLALADHLADKFDLEHRPIEIANPI